MNALNYHHLRYFLAIAHEGNLTRAAKRCHVAQSALSIQLRQLEEALGSPLFEREHKKLVLTEEGKIALDYAESIFKAGDELLDTIKNGAAHHLQKLRVGAPSTLSRNFQFEFLKPILKNHDIEIIIHSGTLRELLIELQTHALDVILSNHPVRRERETSWHSHLLAEQSVSLVSKKSVKKKKFQFPEDLKTTPIMLPTLESNIRSSFDLLMHHYGIHPKILAEVDDMAMLRLLARENDGVTLLPRVVVQDELRDKILYEEYRIPEITERFYAITPTRRFPNKVLKNLMEQQKFYC